ncbi:MAG: hypothetical protein H7329_04105 [Opitutaceae bacterium]|nr:hypothetical protein [Cytophagales bacterium]
MKANKKTESKPKVKSEKGFDVSHKNLVPQLPSQIVNAPKEATDPAEMIKHA